MEPFYFRRGFTRHYGNNAGFTLIELVVVLAVIAAVTTIALSSHSTFNKTLILANTAYDIALTLRSAESFGLGSRALPSSSSAGYGVHFQRGTPGSFILFADTSPGVSQSCTRPDCKPGDRLYSSSDTLVQTYTLGNDITISDFCTFSDRARCASTGDLNSLDIVFARPNPDAFIRANGSAYASYTTACLTISSKKGGSRFISVAVSGQIIAEAPSCP